MALVGDVRDTVAALLPLVAQKQSKEHLDKALKTTEKWRERLHGYVTRADKVSPIRPEFLISTVDELADDDAAITADTGTPCIWVARHVTAKQDRHIFGSFSWASMANAMPNALGIALAYPGRQVIAVCGDGGLSMLIGDLLTRRPQLLAETGCGALTAALLIGRTAGAERFKTDASFARRAGTAPIPCSSGQRDRHRLDRGGDRQLNHALPVIAITRARHDPATRAYLNAKKPRARPRREHCAASNATSRAASTTSSHLPAAQPQPNRGTTDKPPVHPSERDPSDVDASVPSNPPTPMICLTYNPLQANIG
jgi:Transposase IS116/IS110/IS902 family/Thiamine pyrophosphate enzyme, C-terminal TPP binding domain